MDFATTNLTPYVKWLAFLLVIVAPMQNLDHHELRKLLNYESYWSYESYGAYYDC